MLSPLAEKARRTGKSTLESVAHGAPVQRKEYVPFAAGQNILTFGLVR
jgi:hypothetical protein